MKVKVEKISQNDGIYKIYFSHGLCGVFLELPRALKLGSIVEIAFKGSEAVISRTKLEISAENEICAKILDINFGEILSDLTLAGAENFSVIATTQSVRNLALSAGVSVHVYANATAVYIEKIYD